MTVKSSSMATIVGRAVPDPSLSLPVHDVWQPPCLQLQRLDTPSHWHAGTPVPICKPGFRGGRSQAGSGARATLNATVRGGCFGSSAPRLPRRGNSAARQQIVERKPFEASNSTLEQFEERIGAPMTLRKSAAELERSGTALARNATELKHLAASLVKRAEDLQRRSELLLRRAEHMKERRKR